MGVTGRAQRKQHGEACYARRAGTWKQRRLFERKFLEQLHPRASGCGSYAADTEMKELHCPAIRIIDRARTECADLGDEVPEARAGLGFVP